MEEQGYTLDGTVNIGGRPVLASKTGKWKACTFVYVYQALERFAYFGVGANLVNFMTTQLHQDLVSSIRSVNNWSGVGWIAPVLGAYIADSYIGRFWTITVALVIYALGMVLLVLTTSMKDCTKVSTSQITLFYISIYAIAISSGAVKPNMSTFGADQFDDLNPKEKLLKVSFFNYWTFTTSIGALMATLFLVYIQETYGWGLGYALSAVGFLFSFVAFFLGTHLYRHKVRKTKSPTRDIIRVMLVAFRNRKLNLPSSYEELHEFDLMHYIRSKKRKIQHTSRFRFLDKAAIKEGNRDLSDSNDSPCTVTQAEGSKLVLGMFQIWLLMIIPSNFWALESTIFVKQGTTMDRRLGPKFQIPAASLWSFVVVAIFISLPIYDHFFIPFMRQRTKNHRGITLLQKLSIGIAIQLIAIAVACAVEVQRMHIIRKQHIVGPKEIVPMSIFWLLPQHIIIGVSDAFLMTGLLEFFYDQSPEEIQGIGTTFFTSTVAVGSFFSSFLVTMVDKVTWKVFGKSWIGNNLNDCHLDYYYGFLLVMAIFNLMAFLRTSSRYVYKQEIQLEVNGSYDAMEIEDQSSLNHFECKYEQQVEKY